MNKSISHRIQSVQSPIIPIVTDLIRSNPGTISLGQGVVYYGPPPDAISSMQQGLTNQKVHIYCNVHGLPALRKAISLKLAEENNIRLNGVSEVFVTAGSNMGFCNAILAIADPGDEIIMSFPYYFNHQMAVSMLGCKPVLLNTNADYHLSVETVAAAITKKTRAVVTISPNNPTGAVYSQATLEGINRLCRQRGIYHICDEAYENFVFGGHPHFSPGSLESAAEHTISLYSFSKSYGFAGWRIGYMVIPVRLFESVRKIQDTILICPPIISQYAALGAIENGTCYRKHHIAYIEKTRRVILERLDALGDRIDKPKAEGAFYVFLKVNTQKDDMKLLNDLVKQYRVAAIPGSAFGIRDGCFFRIAYGSLRHETAQEGIDRFARGINALVE